MTTPERAGLTVRVTPDNGVLVVALRGEADLVGLAALEAGFDRAAAGRGPILADLTGLDFLDNTGLRSLVQAHTRASSQGRRFAVACSPETDAAKILQLVRLDRVMPVHHDRETAVRSLRG